MDRARAGGGALWDLGVHLIDLVHWWLGPIEALTAQQTITIPQRADPSTGAMVDVTTDDASMLLVRAGGGVPGVLQMSQVAQGRQNHLRVALYGSRGALLYEADRDQEPALRLSRVPAGAPGRADAFAEVAVPRDLLVSYEDFPAFHMGRLVRQLKGTEAFPAFEDGARCQATLEAAERAIRSACWEQVALD
jgi:predicted dehydrogenase